MCYERRRAEACVDESAHHALANAGVGRLWEKRRGSRRGVREGACIGGATMLQPWTLRLTRNAAAVLAAASIQYSVMADRGNGVIHRGQKPASRG